MHMKTPYYKLAEQKGHQITILKKMSFREVDHWINKQKSRLIAPLSHCCKTTFLTKYPMGYLPKGKFKIQLSHRAIMKVSIPT